MKYLPTRNREFTHTFCQYLYAHLPKSWEGTWWYCWLPDLTMVTFFLSIWATKRDSSLLTLGGVTQPLNQHNAFSASATRPLYTNHQGDSGTYKRHFILLIIHFLLRYSTWKFMSRQCALMEETHLYCMRWDIPVIKNNLSHNFFIPNALDWYR